MTLTRRRLEAPTYGHPLPPQGARSSVSAQKRREESSPRCVRGEEEKRSHREVHPGGYTPPAPWGTAR